MARRTATLGSWCRRALPAFVLAWSAAAGAATSGAATVDGATLGVWWSLPFAGLLLSIALLPLRWPRFWHRHFGKIALGWAAVFMLPFAAAHGVAVAAQGVVHTLLAEYLPFTVLLMALFGVAGGIHLRGNLRGTPALNVGLMAAGAVLASFIGTTGASVLLIRPLLRANDNRRNAAHVVVFFIFVVSNAGGALTPLGDPPLFLGFLQGVGFFWTLQQLWPQTLFVVGALLAVFWCIDSHRYRSDGVTPADPTPAGTPAFGIDGAVNIVPLLLVIALVLMSGTWKSGVGFDVWGTTVMLEQVLRDAGLVAVTLLSLAITPPGVRAANRFGWAPLQEVAKLFAAIFVTMLPVLAILKAGEAGAFGGVLRAVTGDDGRPIAWAYFWSTGLLSSVLDNAPTYLVFFNLAGGDAAVLMTTLAPILAAISAGSVFMGAATYIGNAPNFIVKAMAEESGVRMPGFFGYIGWSGAVLLPLLLVVTVIWYR